ncbi:MULTISPECIES: hypothetical protein [Methylobacterium]|uniref:Uncharacterized protein n=1 Tax=Methylobacterium jeotgali TaxID=381630 RepID=A0ABQ4SYI3_9HYPH|nr:MULTISPECIES: hypothetical protein [Methylobacterium]PIU07761.1 MAG: hypothetical protein COT56_03880 [Methylobacterium sp. CG09_land_8_20_14_0_10_71_15]PIU13364.1 MAG: hypothetical protein COT28_11675 [Methylobacterium sp. CG08_land_8_20_14_0_20_71_15]GBU19049.1 hypothetical protein AwMethylo_32640 [Methylobacterium sp.]GJE07942.1 hypothetical protein AOPFMNJM_3274 [Methylobacterium jeotgali]
MAAPTLDDVTTDGHPVAVLRARALADANRLRALACVALRDGAPHAGMRACNARTAARRVLAHARTLSALGPIVYEAGQPA